MNLDREVSEEEKKRVLEVVAVFFTATLLFALSRLETRLFTLSETLSENQEFFTTLAYFALININVILILLLSFLIFRNVTRLILERRRGVLGSKLRTKLVFALVFFALAPTVLMFYVSMKFVTTSFETWFSEKVKVTMQQTREAGSLIYKQDQKRLQSLARIALRRLDIDNKSDAVWPMPASIDSENLVGFASEYGLTTVKVFNLAGQQIWHSQRGVGPFVLERPDPYVFESIDLFRENQALGENSTVVGEDTQDVVKGVAPIRDPANHELLGIILTEVRFETRILKSIEKIISDFGDLKPGAQLIRLSYMILMVVVMLLIIFSAIWMGFYVARAITGPLQSLAGATREIALGNYDVTLDARTDDETGQLVQAFNLMTQDLRSHRMNTLEAQNSLQRSNEELEQRRQYMEIVLKHISAGVVSLDSEKRVQSVNPAAEKLLTVNAKQLQGRPISRCFSQIFYEVFWVPVLEGLGSRSVHRCQIDLRSHGYDVCLIVNATRIFDEELDRGIVVVFDDAEEQVRAQKVAAWKEVARRIAHEIKNPITPIKLSAQRLLRRFHNKFSDDDYEVFGSCIQTIIAQVDSLRDFVNEFSKFSRMPRIRPKEGLVHLVLRDVSQFYLMSYPEVDVDLSGIVPSPPSLFDKEQLNRAFMNIFANAIASLEEGRQGVVVATCVYLPELNAIRVEISDNGCGISKELHDRVLEPYFSTKDEGTGLGLAIVNQIISEHGGYLRISANEVAGTKVVIELPVEKASKNSPV